METNDGYDEELKGNGSSSANRPHHHRHQEQQRHGMKKTNLIERREHPNENYSLRGSIRIDEGMFSCVVGVVIKPEERHRYNNKSMIALKLMYQDKMEKRISPESDFTVSKLLDSYSKQMTENENYFWVMNGQPSDTPFKVKIYDTYWVPVALLDEQWINSVTGNCNGLRKELMNAIENLNSYKHRKSSNISGNDNNNNNADDDDSIEYETFKENMIDRHRLYVMEMELLDTDNLEKVVIGITNVRSVDTIQNHRLSPVPVIVPRLCINENAIYSNIAEDVRGENIHTGFKKEFVFDIVKQLCASLHYNSRMFGFVHRDLKLSNIAISDVATTNGNEQGSITIYYSEEKEITSTYGKVVHTTSSREDVDAENSPNKKRIVDRNPLHNSGILRKHLREIVIKNYGGFYFIVKIIDFGLSSMAPNFTDRYVFTRNSKETSNSLYSPLTHFLLENEKPDLMKCDLWSLGICIITMFLSGWHLGSFSYLFNESASPFYNYKNFAELMKDNPRIRKIATKMMEIHNGNRKYQKDSSDSEVEASVNNSTVMHLTDAVYLLNVWTLKHFISKTLFPNFPKRHIHHFFFEEHRGNGEVHRPKVNSTFRYITDREEKILDAYSVTERGVVAYNFFGQAVDRIRILYGDKGLRILDYCLDWNREIKGSMDEHYSELMNLLY